MHPFIRPLATTLLALGLAQTAESQQRNVGPWAFTVEAGLVAQSEADFDAGDGSFSLERWFVGAGIDYMWDRRNSLGVSIGGGATDFDFENDLGESINGPWGKIEDFRLSVNGRFSFSETGTAFIIPTVRYNREEGASSSNGRTWGLIAGAAWRINEDLTIGPGFGAFDQLSDSARVFPILIIDWDFAERWSLSTGRGLAASQGPGLTLRYALTENWSLGLAGRYEKIDFRLNDEGPAPGGVGRDETLPLVLSASWDPNPGTALAFFVGSEFGGKLELLDAAGDLVEERDYGTSLIAGGTFRLRF